MDSLDWSFFMNGQNRKLSAPSILDPRPDIRILIQHFSTAAVHCLAANPKWAWVRKMKVSAEPTDKENTKLDDEEKGVNWLADEDLLPAQATHAHVKTFNYESKWHRDIPAQRHSLCADELLSALDISKKRKRSPSLDILFRLNSVI